ncbi:MAG: hypothetical protein ACOCV8_04910 [Spirochaetota bacterium]
MEELEKDEFIKDVPGEHIFEKFIELKKLECRKYAQIVTDWEIERYINIY